MDELQALEDWAGALLSQLQPAARRTALIDIARELRRGQQKRIAEQRNPDGSQYEPRKNRLRSKAGRIKRRTMFAKLRAARFLKIENDADGLAIGFSGRVARVARIHQHGETATVARGRTYKYPARVLLGFTDQERDMIRDKLLAHLSR